ncbi:MAG: hypothetical protein IKH22_05530, partial [Prevotella sp.]|nr:hypothetical protein [Prevotella sp.]
SICNAKNESGLQILIPNAAGLQIRQSGPKWKYCCPLKTSPFIFYTLIHQSFGRKAEYGACQSLEETKEHRRGCKPPGNDATTKKAPKGRQRPKYN